MRNRLIVASIATLVVARLLYGWRGFTFLIWTEAAILTHSQPHLAVALLEVFILIQIFLATMIIITLALTDRMSDIIRFLKWCIKGAK